MKSLLAVSRRSMLVAAAGILLGAASFSTNAQLAEPTTELSAPKWVATWSAPPMPSGSAFGASRSFDNQTVRQIMHISAGGTRVRVKLSNEYGVGSLIVGSANVALQATGSSILPASNRSLTFRGSQSVVIPEGATVFSDPVNLNVPSNANVTISIYVPQNTGLATYHENANQTAYISAPGDFSDATDFPADDTAISSYWVTYIDVLPIKKTPALVIIGDSISEGATTTLDANRRVNNVLSRWFNPPFGAPRMAVLNQGIGCGRLLFDFCGPKGLSRFDGNVLNATGVNQVLIELGYVDIIFPTAAGIPEQLVSTEQIIDGLRQLIRRARMRGLRVYGATAQPNGSTTFPNVYTPENEAKRQALNRWIRTTREYDGVADYDLALRDPSNPVQLLPAYDSGDGIHPNDAGHEAMARSIVLSLR